MNQLLRASLAIILIAGLNSTIYGQIVLKSVLPDTAGVISGPTQICYGAAGIEYSVTPIDNATGYAWTLPEGAAITGGNNTNLIIVDFSSEAVAGNISVYGTNDSGNGESSPLLAINCHILPAKLGEAIGIIPNLLDSLVAYYPFNGDYNDESGYLNNASEIYGGVSFTSGKFGQAAKFAGYDNPGHIKVNNSPSLQFGAEASFTAWVRLDDSVGMDGWGQYSMNGNYSIIAKDHDRHGYFESVSYRYDNKLNTGAGYDFHGLVNDSHDVTEYSIGDWIHITYVYSDSTSSLYINGIIDSTSHNVANFAISNQLDLYFGKFSDYWYPFNGALDEVRIYNRALSAEEVACLYNGDCSSLILSAEITENQFCKGGSTSLQLFNAQPGVKYQLFNGEYEVGNPQVGNSDTLTFPIESLYETSSFTVLATDTTTGCSVTLDSTFVVEVTAIEATALADMPYDYIPATVNVTSQSIGAASYEWFLDGEMFAVTPQAQVVIDSTGQHTLVLMVKSGAPDYCTDADTLMLTTTERTEVMLDIPSSFTPNNDGINDYFEFVTEGIDNYSVWIKDSWGVSVFEFDKSLGKWDGLTKSGKEAPTAPYYYHVQAADYTGKAIEKSGVVYLIRDLIDLSPNPAKDNLVVKMNGRLQGERSVQLISVHGKVIYEASVSGETFELDVTGIKPGLYLLRISNQRDILNLKFIKE